MHQIPVALLLLGLLAVPAFAGKVLTISYPVKGKTPAEIHDFIKENAPRIGGRVPYAFTAIATKTNKKTTNAKASCRFKSYQTDIIFTYVLPKLESSKGISSATLAKWRDFSASLKAHETQHKDNWQGCLRDFDKSVLELEARNCETLEKKVQQQLNKTKLHCVQFDRKLDDSYGRELWRHPFVKEAMGDPKGKGRDIFGFFGKKKKTGN